MSLFSDFQISMDKAFLDRIIAVGEFMPSHFKPKILEDSVIPHCVLSQSATFSKYYRATLSFAASDKISSAELEFNTNAKSWGYSYVAHRFKKESKHQFVISILIANEDVCKGEKTYTCVGIFRSTEFQIQCKRRAHNDAIQTVPFFHLCALKGKEVGAAIFSFYFI